ncbi:MAG: prepilin peptidase [Endomicrobia bacterium]|nr:prepilin peptidase [Endomicrobiia bacterium]
MEQSGHLIKIEDNIRYCVLGEVVVSHLTIFFMLIGVFIVGLIFGSFVNVLIYRIPKKLSIILPNSFCTTCLSPIKFYDNIPLISYIFLKGRCRSCKSKVSIQYPLVELLCGVISIFLYIKFGILNMWIFFNLFIVLVAISFIDLRTMEIPDELSYYLIISGVILSIFNETLGNTIFVRISNSLLGGLINFLLFFLIMFFGEKIYKKPVLGGGDVKLMCGLGTYMGVFSGIYILFYGSILASIYVFILYLFKKFDIWGRYIQFAPFLSLGSLIFVANHLK